MDDKLILDWLLANVNYMEHGPGKYNFWPHDDSDPVFIYEEDKLGLTLRQYIEARIKESMA